MNQNATGEVGDPKGRKRIPVSVIVIACLYLAVGIGGSVAHFSQHRAPDWIWIEITELLAIVCGVFLLRAQNWARWLAIAWIAFHVAMSFGVLRQLAVHSVLIVLIVWCLFRPDASRFFRSTQAV
jgi:hypothetical protein